MREPGAVLTVSAASPDDPHSSGAFPTRHRDLRDRSMFDGLIADQLTLSSFARPRGVREMRLGMLVSGNFFSVLGVRPVLGRARAGRGSGAWSSSCWNDFWNNILAGTRRSSRALSSWRHRFRRVRHGARFTGLGQWTRLAFYVPS